MEPALAAFPEVEANVVIFLIRLSPEEQRSVEVVAERGGVRSASEWARNALREVAGGAPMSAAGGAT